MLSKRVIFISKSTLSQNLLEMIIKTIPRKVDFIPYRDMAAVMRTYFPKTVQLVIMDYNAMPKEDAEGVFQEVFSKKNLKQSKKVMIYSREAAIDHNKMKKLGVDYIYAKPFLPNEFIELVSKHLGIKV